VTGFLGIVAALVTVVGGGIVYLWQKAEDRRERYRAEKQEIFKNYLRSMRNVISRAVDAKVHDDGERLMAFNEATREHEHLRDLFELYASSASREIAVALESALNEWHHALLTPDAAEKPDKLAEYFRYRASLVEQMRTELFDSIEEKSFFALYSWLRGAVSRGAK
jgi:hypothetical protein